MLEQGDGSNRDRLLMSHVSPPRPGLRPAGTSEFLDSRKRNLTTGCQSPLSPACPPPTRACRGWSPALSRVCRYTRYVATGQDVRS